MSSCILCFNTIRPLRNYLCTKSKPEEPIPFVIPITSGKVIKVYDGDTITVEFRLPYKKSALYKISVRLNGLDCPELKTKNIIEKECSTIAKQKVSDLLLGNTVQFKNVSMEKYGRLLADVYYQGKSVNQWLLDNHLAVKYDGGTKQAPEDWMVYHNSVTYKEF
tara:strand:+ start:59 stop:550 length:492 start_codon:yes stop_codon:yes gene_type:complete